MPKPITADDIYFHISEDNYKALETPELDRRFKQFHEKYIESIDDYDTKMAKGDLFDAIVFGYSQQGFVAGYKTAFKLLLDALI